MRRASFASLILIVLFVSGCKEQLSGTYEDPAGDSRIEFSGSNKVYITMMGTTTAGEYEIDGDKIIITANGQNMVLTRNGDALEGGPLGMKFIRRAP